MPIVIKRSIKGNARNWPGVIVIDPAARYPAAVYAQELYESERKMNPAFLIRFLTSEDVQRELEVMGHEIEVMAAEAVYSVPAGYYRPREADTMRRLYPRLFGHLSTYAITRRMEACSEDAARWVSRNIRRIERYRDL